MSPARVLIVDDSVVVRRALSGLVERDAALALAGTAPSAMVALQKIAVAQPDVVVLDVDMPEMDGFEAARRMHAEWPKLPILMCSGQSERAAAATLKALAAGATDYIAKPSSMSAQGGLEDFAAEFTAKLKALARPAESETARPAGRPLSSPSGVRAAMDAAGARVDALAIGCSTGGTNVLSRVLGELTAPPPVPLFIVQHMPAVFTRLMAERLSQTTKLRVEEGREGMRVERGVAYVAPGGFHMTVKSDAGGAYVALDQRPPEHSCRPAVDALFRSLPGVYGAGVLAMVFTGMGHDGTAGARAIVERGGRVLAQDPASCVAPSMPSTVLAAGLAQPIALESIARIIANLVGAPAARGEAR